MLDLLKYSFVSENGKIIKKDNSVILCAKKNTQTDNECNFLLSEPFHTKEYVVMEYRCIGIRRKLLKRASFAEVLTETGKKQLICFDDLIFDNKKHSIIVKTGEGKASGIRFAFGTDRRETAEIEIYSMYTCNKKELPVSCQGLCTETHNGYSSIDISDRFNKEFSFDDEQSVIDGGRFFESEEVSLCNIPFKVSLNKNNLIAPDAPPKENNDIIVNFGVASKRRLSRPVSRDSKIEIAIDKEITEGFFLMSLCGKRHQRWGFATDGTILGDYCGDVTMPLTADDVEQFCVEIIYADGKRDTALPLNILTKRHSVQGDMNLYAFVCNGSRVKSIVFHNKMLDTDCCIAAVTVNETKNLRFPEMLIPKKPEKIVHNITSEKSISIENKVLNIKNNALEFVIDITDGLMLKSMKNEYTPEFSIQEDYMLKLRGEDGSVVTQFKLISAKVERSFAEINYVSGQCEFCVKAELGEASEVKWNITAKNNGEDSIKTGIIFPAISKIKYSQNSDGWYFFPKYQNINSNETVYIYEESAPSFPMQFFDVYSPLQQGGISFTTREKGLIVRKYALEKDENGISAFIEYPYMYGNLAPGESFSASEAVISAHDGDWHRSFELYKKWLKTWYKPYKCQNKKWYRESFWLLAEIIDFFETEEFCDLPVWYDKKKKEFKFEKILEEQKSITGVYPDILHLWSWAYKKEGTHFTQQWGNFGNTDYDEYGGMEAFREALHNIREKGVNVSLYLHPTLLSGRYPQSKEYFPKYRVINENGEFISIEGDSYRMCHANEKWREYAVGMYPRIYKELGIPLLYVDEFSLRIENRCYCDSHGHSVPSNLLKTDRDFITQLKNAMPEEVVLYGEYYAVDVNAAYIDCNISYYIIDSVVDMVESAWRCGDGDDALGRVFTDLYRFAFPGIVQLILPMAMRNMSWHPQKFLFFNGEAIYDSFWDCEESAGLDFTVKAYKLKKKYADCFSSDDPETMIETLSPAICANCFPGEKRTVYTLYNRAYSTYRGEALSIKRENGNTYYDAWNDKELNFTEVEGYAHICVEMGAQEIGCIEVRKSETPGFGQ